MIRYLPITMFFIFASNAQAAESVQFTNKELAAVFTLMRPELNSIELNARTVTFNPSPSLKFLGVGASVSPLDLTVIGNIVDLEFNHIKAKTPEIKFQNNIFEVSVPIEDRDRGVQSKLGSISFKNVALRAQFVWNTRTDGSQELVLSKTNFDGTLSGTGILRSSFILGKTRDLLVSLLRKSMVKFIESEKFQTSVNSGLISYSKFYTGMEIMELVPGSIQFYNDGIQYNVN